MLAPLTLAFLLFNKCRRISLNFGRNQCINALELAIQPLSSKTYNEGRPGVCETTTSCCTMPAGSPTSADKCLTQRYSLACTRIVINPKHGNSHFFRMFRINGLHKRPSQTAFGGP